MLSEKEQRARAKLREADALETDGDVAGAIERRAAALEVLRGEDDVALRSLFAAAAIRQARAQRMAHELQPAIALLDEVARDCASVVVAGRYAKAEALVLRAMFSFECGARRDAEASAESVLKEHEEGRADTPSTVRALAVLADIYAGDADKAARKRFVLEKLVALTDGSAAPDMRRYRANAMHNLARDVRADGDVDRALRLWAAVIEMRNVLPSEVLVPDWAAYARVETLADMGEVRAAFDEAETLVARLRATLRSAQGRGVAELALLAADALLRADAPKQALTVYEELDELTTAQDEELRVISARALINRAVALTRLGQFDTAIEATHRLFEIGSAAVLALRAVMTSRLDVHNWSDQERRAWALLMMGLVQADLGEMASAERTLTELVDGFGDDNSPLIVPLVETAQAALEEWKRR